jgi:hypothetical protein
MSRYIYISKEYYKSEEVKKLVTIIRYVMHGRRFSDLQTARHHVPGPLLSTIYFSSDG